MEKTDWEKVRHVESEIESKILGQAWSAYPIRLLSDRLHKCDRSVMHLLKGKEGGFVIWRCPVCPPEKSDDYVTAKDWNELQPYVVCAACNDKLMMKEMIEKNYGFRCKGCGKTIILADLVPSRSTPISARAGW